MDHAVVTDVVQSMARTFHAFRAIRRHQPVAVPGLDPTNFGLLFALVKGPQRVSAVADDLALDLSTVSRQVTALSGLGLVSKGPDPVDRRAHVVSLTPDGFDAVVQIEQQRDLIYGEVFFDWSQRELDDLNRHLARLADALETRARLDTTR